MEAPHHVLPLNAYLRVFYALLILTALTTAVAFVDLGPMNTFVALTIASIKALCVVLVFMHVRWSGQLIWILIGAGIFWLLILLGFTMADYVTRVPVVGW